MNRDNRKSHLLHHMSPSLRELFEAEQAHHLLQDGVVLDPAHIIARRQPRAEIQRLLAKMSALRASEQASRAEADAAVDESSLKTPVAAHPPSRSAQRIVTPELSPSHSDSYSGPSTATAATFSLPVRSGPPAGPLPTPPPTYTVSDDVRSDRSDRSERTERAERPRRTDRPDRPERPAERRQVAYGIPANPSPSSRY